MKFLTRKLEEIEFKKFPKLVDCSSIYYDREEVDKWRIDTQQSLKFLINELRELEKILTVEKIG